MRRLWLLVLLLFACHAPARAQFVSVTAQVKDSNGNLYQNCTGNVNFVPSPTATTVPTIGGSVFQTTYTIASCDSFGNFAITLPDNALIQDGHTGPTASQWVFFIQSSSVCFAGQKFSFSDTLTITGASQNITSSLQAAAAPLPSCGSVGGSPGQIIYNNAGSASGIPGSNVTPSTGAITLTAGADTTIPLAIASHSTTQSATELDVNNQSSGTADTPAVVRGRGFGSFTPAGNKALLHLMEESNATAPYGLVLSNRAADVAKGVSNYSVLIEGVSDTGLAQIASGAGSTDANNLYSGLFWTSSSSMIASFANPAGPVTAAAGVTPFSVQGSNGQTADIFEVKGSGGSVLSRADLNGTLDSVMHVTVTTGSSASLADGYFRTTAMNQEATAGAAVTYTLPTAANGITKCAMNSNNGSAADTGVLTIATSASGQFIIGIAGTLTASGGNITSGGAGGDSACVIGVDATHWQLFVQNGTWTLH